MIQIQHQLTCGNNEKECCNAPPVETLLLLTIFALLLIIVTPNVANLEKLNISEAQYNYYAQLIFIIVFLLLIIYSFLPKNIIYQPSNQPTANVYSDSQCEYKLQSQTEPHSENSNFFRPRCYNHTNNSLPSHLKAIYDQTNLHSIIFSPSAYTLKGGEFRNKFNFKNKPAHNSTSPITSDSSNTTTRTFSSSSGQQKPTDLFQHQRISYASHHASLKSTDSSSKIERRESKNILKFKKIAYDQVNKNLKDCPNACIQDNELIHEGHVNKMNSDKQVNSPGTEFKLNYDTVQLNLSDNLQSNQIKTHRKITSIEIPNALNFNLQQSNNNENHIHTPRMNNKNLNNNNNTNINKSNSDTSNLSSKKNKITQNCDPPGIIDTEEEIYETLKDFQNSKLDNCVNASLVQPLKKAGSKIIKENCKPGTLVNKATINNCHRAKYATQIENTRMKKGIRYKKNSEGNDGNNNYTTIGVNPYTACRTKRFNHNLNRSLPASSEKQETNTCLTHQTNSTLNTHKSREFKMKHHHGLNTQNINNHHNRTPHQPRRERLGSSVGTSHHYYETSHYSRDTNSEPPCKISADGSVLLKNESKSYDTLDSGYSANSIKRSQTCKDSPPLQSQETTSPYFKLQKKRPWHSLNGNKLQLLSVKPYKHRKSKSITRNFRIERQPNYNNNNSTTITTCNLEPENFHQEKLTNNKVRLHPVISNDTHMTYLTSSSGISSESNSETHPNYVHHSDAYYNQSRNTKCTRIHSNLGFHKYCHPSHNFKQEIKTQPLQRKIYSHNDYPKSQAITVKKSHSVCTDQIKAKKLQKYILASEQATENNLPVIDSDSEHYASDPEKSTQDQSEDHRTNFTNYTCSRNTFIKDDCASISSSISMERSKSKETRTSFMASLCSPKTPKLKKQYEPHYEPPTLVLDQKKLEQIRRYSQMGVPIKINNPNIVLGQRSLNRSISYKLTLDNCIPTPAPNNEPVPADPISADQKTVGSNHSTNYTDHTNTYTEIHFSKQNYPGTTLNNTLTTTRSSQSCTHEMGAQFTGSTNKRTRTAETITLFDHSADLLTEDDNQQNSYDVSNLNHRDAKKFGGCFRV